MPPKFYKKRYTKKPASASGAGGDNSASLRNAIYLIIVESPSKCKKIEEYLGSEYHCIASKGHIRDIQGLKSIDTKRTFEPIFTEIEEKKAHIENMRRIISKFHPANVILATDDDREGEAIAWHICQIFALPVETTKRILFHEITQDAILEAVNTPTIVNMALVHAQKARQVLDMIVGYKISPYLWKLVNNSNAKTLSAGRCQTPALRLVYDNHEENRRDQMTMRYKIRGTFTSKSIVFDLDTEFDTAAEVLRFMEASQTWQHILHTEAAKDGRKAAPRPFNTSRLLQTASNVLHMTTKETMNLAQQLYQAGHITYMRTESSQYSPVFLEKMKTFIVGKWSNMDYLADFSKLENKDKSKAHEAIRITNIQMSALSGGGGDEPGRAASLYKLIWRNTVESCMADAKYRNTTVKISAPEDKTYNHIVEVPVFMGWKVVGGGEGGGGCDQNGQLFFLKTIETNATPVSYNYIESELVARNKHSYYTEAGIIHKLEEMGIGRPSTFASIVDTIQERGYVKRKNIEGKVVKAEEYRLAGGGGAAITKTVKQRTFGEEKSKLCIEPTGEKALKLLLKYFHTFFSYEYTRHMEEELDAVASSGRDWAEICRNCYNEIKVLSKILNGVIKKTYDLTGGGGGGGETGAGNRYVFSFGKYGPVVEEIAVAAAGDAATELVDANKKPLYLPVKKNVEIDIDKLEKGEYSVEDLSDISNSCLGEFKGEKVYLKTGRYGNYVEYGEKTKSIKSIKKEIGLITWKDIEPILAEEDNAGVGEDGVVAGSEKKKRGIIRVLNENMSVRNGKFGSYVYYKTPEMKSPQFLNIKHFPDGFMICSAEILVEWVRKTYNI